MNLTFTTGWLGLAVFVAALLVAVYFMIRDSYHIDKINRLARERMVLLNFISSQGISAEAKNQLFDLLSRCDHRQIPPRPRG